MTESRLTLTPVSEDDASHLICRVKNSMIPGAVMEDSVRLDVHCKSSLLLSPLILCDQSEIELLRQFQHQRLFYVFCPVFFVSFLVSLSIYFFILCVTFISWAFCLYMENGTKRRGSVTRFDRSRSTRSGHRIGQQHQRRRRQGR